MVVEGEGGGRLCLCAQPLVPPPPIVIDVPSDLTGDLPDESGALGKEALPPGDPGGRSPGGDLCIDR